MKKGIKDYLLRVTIYAIVFTALENIAGRLKLMRRLRTSEIISNFVGFVIADVIFDRYIRDKVFNSD